MTAPSLPARLLLLGVRGYRRLFAGRPTPCRFLPTCSAYAEEAVLLHGSARGSWLAVRRIGRCRPGGGSGFDPVPDRRGVRGVPASSTPTPSAAAPGQQPQATTKHPRRVS